MDGLVIYACAQPHTPSSCSVCKQAATLRTTCLISPKHNQAMLSLMQAPCAPSPAQNSTRQSTSTLGMGWVGVAAVLPLCLVRETLIGWGVPSEYCDDHVTTNHVPAYASRVYLGLKLGACVASVSARQVVCLECPLQTSLRR